MKTRNNTTGNRNNQLSGVLLRVAAVLVSVVLLSFTVSAQDLLKELLSYNSFGKMALIMVDNSTAETEAELVSGTTANFYIEEEAEAPLNLEEWMTSDTYFGSSDIFYEVAQEESLEIESWMTDEDYYTGPYTTDLEPELNVEAWMCDASYFNKN